MRTPPLTTDDVLDVVEMTPSQFAFAWEGIVLEVIAPSVGLPQTWEHFLLLP